MKGREAPVRASQLIRAKDASLGRGRARRRPRSRARRRCTAWSTTSSPVAAESSLLTGAPGIGKTRLLTELRDCAADEVTWLEGHCHSYGGLPGWPFVEILLGWLGAEIGEPEIADQDEGARRARSAARRRARRGPRPARRAAATPTRRDTRDRGGRRIAGVRPLARAARAAQPVIVVLEDTQWADAPTRELAEHVLELTDRAPVALVLTDEPIPGSEGAALRLACARRLRAPDDRARARPAHGRGGRAAARTRSSADELDAVTRTGLIREAEGNPLYLEELARAFLEGALEPRGRTWTVTIGSLELLPPTLENLLVARIDRLADGPRRLAQIAAAIGRTFPVARARGRRRRERRGGPDGAPPRRDRPRGRRYPEFECAFTHGLLHDAALSTLTSTRKRALYADIAAAFEAIYADSLDEHLERLAHYHAQAGSLPKALEYAERARSASS